jgi:hypothetical protein
MNTHPSDSELHDYLDGDLDPARDAAVARHVEQCDSCRAVWLRQRQLRHRLAALPREMEPPADALRNIHRALAAGDRSTAPVTEIRGVRRWRPRTLAAAAVLLVALSSALTALLVLRYAPPRGVVLDEGSIAPPAAELVALNAMEGSYNKSIVELERALKEYEHALAPETVRLIRTNLEIVDRALTEARVALHADPANAALVELLRANYERKLDVLRSASSYAATRL